MDLNKDRKIVIFIPHADDELICCLSILNRHPNPNNIYAITLVNEPIIQNYINGYEQELEYGVFMINEVFKTFHIPKNHCLRVFKTMDIMQDCFNLLTLINPSEVYVSHKIDGHDDHQLFYNITKKIQKLLKYKMYLYLIHYPIDSSRPKPNHIIHLTDKEKSLKEELRKKVYPEKKDIPEFLKERYGEREEFYNDLE